MSGFDDVVTYFPQLAQTFEQNVRASASSTAPKRGWGQFLSNETHHTQIGPYGTSAGILVRTLAGAGVDEPIIEYISDVWASSSAETTRYFVENIRVAFLVLGLSRARDPKLVALRRTAIKELVGRQKPDGSWGDWYDASGNAPPPSRTEPTSWCALALSEVPESYAHASAERAAAYLRKLIPAERPERFDVFSLAVVCKILDPNDVGTRVSKAAFDALRQIAVEDNSRISIYFFDYPNGTSEMRRDYLCVPLLFVRCLLANGVGRTRKSWIRSARAASSTIKIYAAVKAETGRGLFRPRDGSSPATVDQALIALGAVYVSAISSKWVGALSAAGPIWSRIGNNLVTRVIVPALVLLLLVPLATNPDAVGEAWTKVVGVPDPKLEASAQSISAIAQGLAAFVLVLCGQSLVTSIFNKLRSYFE